MISIIITAFKEAKTIGKAIEAIETQNLPTHETLVVAPDDETLLAAKKYQKKFKYLKIINDPGDGKPAALNFTLPKTKGKILVLTDGDIYLASNSISELLKPFQDPEIGAVTGHPVPTDSRKNKFGFWAHLLTEIAHERRLKATKLKKRFFCSGYLFAIRKSLFPNLPTELLSEDGYISHKVYQKNYKIAYAENARVHVKFPTNFKDWIIQKKRSTGGYNQIRKLTGAEIRSFKKESSGIFGLFKHAQNPQELFWLFQLFFARIYLWWAIYRDVSIKKKSREELWGRVESTK